MRLQLLADVLPVSALAAAPGKNPFLSFAVLGVGADGYSALVAYGEISPDFAGKQILVATTQDVKPLPRPRGSSCRGTARAAGTSAIWSS